MAVVFSMSYFADLTVYTYSKWDSRPNTLNVGWLDQARDCEKSSTDDDTVAKLWKFCGCSIGQTRGFHACNLPGCRGHLEHLGPMRAIRGRIALKLGSAEIRVFGSDGKIYAAPNLIYHYVTVHGYKMPTEFVLALENCPDPDSAEYLERLKALGLPWSKTFVEAAPPS